jgi:hypothetical protein
MWFGVSVTEISSFITYQVFPGADISNLITSADLSNSNIDLKLSSFIIHGELSNSITALNYRVPLLMLSFNFRFQTFSYVPSVLSTEM